MRPRRPAGLIFVFGLCLFILALFESQKQKAENEQPERDYGDNLSYDRPVD